MALIKCPECGKEISDTVEQCIHCGFKLESKENNYQNSSTNINEDARENKTAYTSKKTIYEEAKERKKRKGCGTGCLTIIIALFLFGAISTCFDDNTGDSTKPSTESSVKAEVKEEPKVALTAGDILKQMEDAFNNKEWFVITGLYGKIKDEFPNSEELVKAKELYDKSETLKKEEEAKKIAEEQKAKELKASYLKKLKKEVDDVEGITWYKQKYFTHYNNSNHISLYMGEKNGSVWLRLVMSYTGDNWIFFDNAYLSYDGNTIEIPFDKYSEYKSDNDTTVWEWIDVSPTAGTIAFLKDFAKSSSAKMRLSGKYTKTRTLTQSERSGIIDVLNGYEALKN